MGRQGLCQPASRGVLEWRKPGPQEVDRASGHLMRERDGAEAPGHSPRPCSSCGSQPGLKQQQQAQEQLQTQTQAGSPRGRASTPVAKVARTAGGGEAVGKAHVADRFLATAAGGVHAAFVDDGPHALGYSVAYEAIFVIPTAHVRAWAPGGVRQLTEDAVLDAPRTWAKNQHQKQRPAKDHGGLAAWRAPKPGRSLS